MILTRKFSLSMISNDQPLIIRSSSRVSSSRLQITLMSTYGELIIPSNISIQGVLLMRTHDTQTPKGKVGSFSLVNGSPVFTVDLDPEMTSEIGYNECEIALLFGEGICLNSASFFLDVQ